MASSFAALKEQGNELLKSGQFAKAVQKYGAALACDGITSAEAAVALGNRSLAHLRGGDPEAASADAAGSLARDPSYSKARYRLAQAEKALAQAKATATAAPAAAPPPPPASTAEAASKPAPELGGEATALKEQGTAAYKAGRYAEAEALYGRAADAQRACVASRDASDPQAAAELRGVGLASLLGNRAAARLMRRQHDGAAEDCGAALQLLAAAGGGGAAGAALESRLRLRRVASLLPRGRVQDALCCLRQGQGPALAPALEATGAIEVALARGDAAARGAEAAAALRAFQEVAKLVAAHCGASAAGGGGGGARAGSLSALPWPALHARAARCLLPLRRWAELGRLTQRLIDADGNNLEAYTLRAEALLGLGQEEQALRHLQAALRRDPDCAAAATRFRALKRRRAETERLRTAIAAAEAKREHERVAELCAEGLALEASEADRKRAVGYAGARARARQRAAKVASRDATAAGKAAAARAWRLSLKDAALIVYEDACNVEGFRLKATALQALGKAEEAVEELEAAAQRLRPDPREASGHALLSALREAKFEARRVARPDLYQMLGVRTIASAREVQAAYKRKALECHPDRFAGKGEQARAEAEGHFKALGDAVEVLTDPFRRDLYDKGHDLAAIREKVQEKEQGCCGGGRGGG
eukprot:g4244.t1